MQYKLWKYLQYGYLVVAVVFLIEGILTLNQDFTKAMILFGFMVFSFLIFVFKRNFRKKIEQRNQRNDNFRKS